MCMLLLLLQHTLLPTSMWGQIICLRIGCFQSGTFSLRCLRQLFAFGGLPEVDLLTSSHSTQCQHYFTLENPLPLGALGLNAFSHPWTFQVSYVFPPLALVLSKFWQNLSMVNSDIWFWWCHVGCRLLGFPQFSTCWQMFLSSVPL